MTYIDLHTHGLGGYDSRSKDPEEYLRLSEAMARHGTSAFLPTLFPAPVEEMRLVMKAVKRAMEMQSPARILGVHLEGPFVNPAKSGALDKGAFVKPGLKSLARLIDGFEDIVKIMVVAPELPGALGVIGHAVKLGIRVNMGHSDATFMQASEGRKAGATGVTHLFNAMSPMRHREPGLAGYALADDSLYVEIIADMAHVHPAVLLLVLKCKPSNRIILVSDSLRDAKTEDVPVMGPVFMPDGETLAGSGITLSDAVNNMVHLGLKLEEAQSLASDNPRRYLEGG